MHLAKRYVNRLAEDDKTFVKAQYKTQAIVLWQEKVLMWHL